MMEQLYHPMTAQVIMFEFDSRFFRIFSVVLLAGWAGWAVGAVPAQTVPATDGTQPLPVLTPEVMGDTLMAEQRYQAAIESYQKTPQASAELQNKLGIAYQKLGNLNEALRRYQSSLHLDPHFAKAMNNLGTVFDATREYGAAERMYRRALRYEPGSAMFEMNLGTALMAEHKFKKGAEAYQRALEMDPSIFARSDSPRVDNPANATERGAMNYYMARTCVRVGQNDRAIEFLRKALNEGFTNPQKLMADGDFAALHGVAAFEEMVASNEAR